MSTFIRLLAQRVVLLDGAMGTALQARAIPASDYRGLENCSEILIFSRPDVVREIHGAYLDAGCDAVETNTFGANRVVLTEFGLADQVEALNRRAVELAREACVERATPDRPRFVVGSVGPGTRLPSLGQISWDELEDAYREQGRALLMAGADVVLVETCQDLLQAKAALAAILDVRDALGLDVPVIAQVTLQPSGTMLVGSDVSAALAVLDAYDIAAVGLNCASGPHEMAPHVAWLGRHSRKPVSILPNAGLPSLVAGRTVYPLGPDAFADRVLRFVEEDGVSIVGGCCGTLPVHIAAMAARLGLRPAPTREIRHEPAIASLYTAVPLRQEADVLSIGERTNANGSAAFRNRLKSEDWDGIVTLGREQVRRGSHAVDVCTAMVGRDEARDMVELITRFRTQVPAPLVVDSTEPGVLEGALKLIGGRPIINSVNLEGGPERASQVCRLARKYGAALIALLIDESGMARTLEHKIAVAQRIHDLAVRDHGLDPASILFDPLTFTLGTGQDSDRDLARWTLEGIDRIARLFPKSGILLGVSNVSFGLAPAARQVLNSVFLHEAREAGLTAAILHASGIVPLHSISEARRRAATDLIFDRRSATYDPLTAFLGLFEGKGETTETPVRHRQADPAERLYQRVIDGDRDGLDEDLGEAMSALPPLEIINGHLLRAMQHVGELFGRGDIQLPFVLQSAETMKAAVSWLEPHMPAAGDRGRGKMVLATVRGDVHDIGKNLVDILLSNNGFQVMNLGIQVPVEQIVQACREQGPDAVGMSGLLVRSTLTMRDNLIRMREAGIRVPVVLGGAALTRSFVEGECRDAYEGEVHYAKDAFDGIRCMEMLERRRAQGGSSEPAPRPPRREARPRPDPAPLDEPIRFDHPVPQAPFQGHRVIRPRVDALLPWLDTKTLFSFQWGFKRGGRSEAEQAEILEGQARPALERLLDQAHHLLRPQVAVRHLSAQGEGEILRIYRPEGETLDLPFPRRNAGLSVTDFFRRVGGVPDLVTLIAVTVGPVPAAVQAFERGAWQEYLFIHGFAVEMTEALMAWAHDQVRQDLSLAPKTGCRYAFGYPACPPLRWQRPVLDLLDAPGLVLEMTEGDMLVPEFSTVALVCHHPQARHFAL